MNDFWCFLILYMLPLRPDLYKVKYGLRRQLVSKIKDVGVVDVIPITYFFFLSANYRRKFHCNLRPLYLFCSYTHKLLLSSSSSC